MSHEQEINHQSTTEILGVDCGHSLTQPKLPERLASSKLDVAKVTASVNKV